MNKTCKFFVELVRFEAKYYPIEQGALQASGCIAVSANPNAFK